MVSCEICTNDTENVRYIDGCELLIVRHIRDLKHIVAGVKIRRGGMMFFRIDTQNNTYYISKHHIRYVQCHKKNEAIPRSSVVPESDATAVEIFMSEGRRTFLFTKEEYDSKTTVELEDY